MDYSFVMQLDQQKKEENKVENETEEEEYYENDESNDEVKKVKKDLSYLLNESIRMFEFYKKSVKVIENTTEEDLYLIEDKYKKIISVKSKVYTFDCSICEIFHHVHKLHPNIYPELPVDCFDLVKLTLKHLKFMKEVIDTIYNNNENNSRLEIILNEGLENYCEFLISLRKAKENEINYQNPVPCLLVDHIWHSHMNNCDLYHLDCLRICGHYINHKVDN